MNVNGEHNKNAATKLPMPASCDRLDSWKQVAVYLGREVRTVQRWEKCEDLPVRRHIHLKGGTVHAFKNEIDAWLTSKGQKPSESRPIQKRCGQTVNAFNPPPRVMKQMLSAFRPWLAFEVRESCRGRGDLAVPDVRLVPHDPNIFTERLKSRRNVRRRQLESPSRCRALSLRVEMTLEAYKDEADDVPLELFPAGELRWLGVEIRGQAPQSRTLLLSVPYALKALDAEKLSGKSLSDFVLSESLGEQRAFRHSVNPRANRPLREHSRSRPARAAQRPLQTTSAGPMLPPSTFSRTNSKPDRTGPARWHRGGIDDDFPAK